MKRKIDKLALVAIILLPVLLTGCWQEKDSVSIESDGSIRFESEIIITEKVSAKEVDELSEKFVKEFRNAGWQIEKEWISKEEPIRLSVIGEGNLHRLKSVRNFYHLEEIGAKTYSIRFMPLKGKDNRNVRTIIFDQGFFNGVEITDHLEEEVDEITDISSDKAYRIRL